MVEGYITVVFGTMWSGKTTIAVNEAKAYQKAGRRVFINEQYNTRSSYRDIGVIAAKDSELDTAIVFETVRNPAGSQETGYEKVLAHEGRTLKQLSKLVADPEKEGFFKDTELYKSITDKGKADSIAEGLRNSSLGKEEAMMVVYDELHLVPETELASVLRDLLTFKHYGATVMAVGLLLDCYSGFRVFQIWSYLLPLSKWSIVPESRKECEICGSKTGVILTSPKGNNELNKVGDGYFNQCLMCYSR